ncbi:glycosyltransferase [Leucobacter iarius]|uniref:glycosyltransferase n=1 Tax=Leucobacter iarius TaxID=333963 RepID=UPI0031DC9253
MRFFGAITALVLAGVMLILGIGQRTFLAGPAEIEYQAKSSGEEHYAVIPASAFDEVTGQPSVVLEGKNAFAAIGATRDVEAWAAEYRHLEIGVDTKQKRLNAATVAAEAPKAADGGDSQAEAAKTPELLDPRGSDLWLAEYGTGVSNAGASPSAAERAGTLRVPVALKSDQSILIATNGADPLPQKIALAWAQDRSTPLAGPFLVAGGVLALIGALLYLLAVDHDRRGLGPRRGRRGPLQGIRNFFSRGGKRRAAPSTTTEAPKAADAGSGTAQRTAVRRLRRAAIPIGLAGLLALSGCSASYWPQFGGDAAPSETTTSPSPSKSAPVPVNDDQIKRIIGSVADAATQGDDSLDAKQLEARFTGDALQQRTANYKIRAKVKDYEVVPPRITNRQESYKLVQSTEDWPRVVLATVASEPGVKKASTPSPSATKSDAAQQQEESPTLALMLVQDNPHVNFQVSRVVALRGGQKMPDAAPAEEGTARVSDDLSTLALTPAAAVADYAKVLQGGDKVAEASAFNLQDDVLVTKSGAAWVAQAQAKAKKDGNESVKYSVTVTPSDSELISLSTGVGGALVSATLREERIEDSAGGRAKPTATASVTALSGLEGRQDKLVRVVTHQILFFIPSKTSGGQVQRLGVTSELVEARK